MRRERGLCSDRGEGVPTMTLALASVFVLLYQQSVSICTFASVFVLWYQYRRGFALMAVEAWRK